MYLVKTLEELIDLPNEYLLREIHEQGLLIPFNGVVRLNEYNSAHQPKEYRVSISYTHIVIPGLSVFPRAEELVYYVSTVKNGDYENMKLCIRRTSFLAPGKLPRFLRLLTALRRLKHAKSKSE